MLPSGKLNTAGWKMDLWKMYSISFYIGLMQCVLYSTKVLQEAFHCLVGNLVEMVDIGVKLSPPGASVSKLLK